MSTLDITKNLKTTLNNFPKSNNDFNIICQLTYGQYVIKRQILEVLLLPINLMKTELEELINSFNKGFYDEIMRAINAIDAAVKSVFPGIPKDGLTIKIDLAGVGALLGNTCNDFVDSLSSSLFNLFADAENGLLTPMLDIASGLNDIAALPANLTADITNQVLLLKEEALKTALSTLYDTVLYPLKAYEEFLKSNGILGLIQSMKKMETCMMKKGICNRPRKDFINSKDTKNRLWSKYFTDSFMMDSKGHLNLLNFPSSNTNNKRLLNDIKKRMSYFRVAIT